MLYGYQKVVMLRSRGTVFDAKLHYHLFQRGKESSGQDRSMLRALWCLEATTGRIVFQFHQIAKDHLSKIISQSAVQVVCTLEPCVGVLNGGISIAPHRSHARTLRHHAYATTLSPSSSPEFLCCAEVSADLPALIFCSDLLWKSGQELGDIDDNGDEWD